MSVAIDRDQWKLPPLDSPDLAHITPELRPLAVPVDRVEHLPGNYHQGDVGVVSGSLERFQQRKPIVVNRLSGHVEAGNTTLDATVANRRRWVAAVLVEDDPSQEKAYAVVDNRAQELGLNDQALLAAMLIEVHQADLDLFAVTGYDGDDLDDLIKDLGLMETPSFDPVEPTRGESYAPTGIGAGPPPGSHDEYRSSSLGHAGTEAASTPTPADRAAAYEASASKSIVATYDLAQYAWITAHLAQLRRSYGVESNADVLLALVEDATGSHAPNFTRGHTAEPGEG